MLKLNRLFSLLKLSPVLLGFFVSSSVTSSSENSNPSAKSFNVEPWIQDFEQLKGFLANSYPNLEWMVEHRKLNLPDMNRATAAKLRAATSVDDAKKILREFLEQFDDPHLKLVLPNPSTTTSINDNFVLTKESSGELACEKMGAKFKDNNFLFPLDDRFRSISTTRNAFKAGVVKTQKGTIGILRIHSFDPLQYLSTCIEAWNLFRSSLSGDCDEKCRDTFLHNRLENQLIVELQKTIVSLKEQKITALILDLTHNGGGSSWEEGVREMFTDKHLTCGQTGFIRHPHWVKRFEEDLAESQLKMTRAKSDSERQPFAKKVAETERNLNEARTNCNRDKVWLDEHFKPTCSLVVKLPQEQCDVWKGYKFKRGVYTGPIFVLVDNYTASASEDLVARFKDNKVAKIVGERTLGGGCGYTNGGIPYRLKNSSLQVKIPDCVRYFDNGTNEVARFATFKDQINNAD